MTSGLAPQPALDQLGYGWLSRLGPLCHATAQASCLRSVGSLSTAAATWLLPS